MRPLKIVLGLLLGSLLLVACGGGNDLPTRVPESEELPVNDSPREALPANPTPDISLPPTWTPAPPPPPAPTSAPPTAAPPQPTLQTYVVQRGDTLAEVAERFNVSLTELSRVNSISDVDRIEVGVVLIIPAP